LNGTWVLISTLRFPSFWKEAIEKLQELERDKLIVNTFRLFIDLQGYTANEIPRSFLFDNSAVFFLTERNNEDMEGFNDVWANILQDNVIDTKEAFNGTILPQSSLTDTVKLNLESNMNSESSI
jgi:hypothetical protein